jgi:Peptidase family M48
VIDAPAAPGFAGRGRFAYWRYDEGGPRAAPSLHWRRSVSERAEPTLSPDLLEPLPYLQQVAAWLEQHEPELWRWVASAPAQSQYVEQLRVQLLKETYRLDAAAHPQLATACATAAERLGIQAPVTLYHGPGPERNAGLWCLPDEAHVILTGEVLSLLDPLELQALLAHELAHHRLWHSGGRKIWHADRLLQAAANDPRATPGHVQTARRFRLYTELYADRGALLGCGDLEVAVAMLVKVTTGLGEVSAAAYLQQADEICARGPVPSTGIDHPETYVRARALRLWAERDPGLDGWLTSTIEGSLCIDQLDLPGQQRLQGLTRRLLAALLRPRWFRTAATLLHARRYFPDFAEAPAEDPSLCAELGAVDASTRTFLCWLLLDFATADPDLEELPLCAALEWSRRLGLEQEFDALAARELGLGKRALQRSRREAAAMLARGEAGGG